jgi:hypothetical protein
MRQCTRSRTVRKAQSVSSPEIAELLGPDPLAEALRGKTRDLLATLFDEELTQVLAAAKGERVASRCGDPAWDEGTRTDHGAWEGAASHASGTPLDARGTRARMEESPAHLLPAAGSSSGRSPVGGVPVRGEQPADQGGAGAPAAGRAALQKRGGPGSWAACDRALRRGGLARLSRSGLLSCTWMRSRCGPGSPRRWCRPRCLWL